MTECKSMQTNWNPKFQIYSVIKNLKRKDFNFLTKSYRFFIITHEKVKKFQVLRKFPLVIFPFIMEVIHKKDLYKFSTNFFSRSHGFYVIRGVFLKPKIFPSIQY